MSDLLLCGTLNEEWQFKHISVIFHSRLSVVNGNCSLKLKLKVHFFLGININCL
jgi:hypothetical protein